MNSVFVAFFLAHREVTLQFLILTFRGWEFRDNSNVGNAIGFDRLGLRERLFVPA